MSYYVLPFIASILFLMILLPFMLIENTGKAKLTIVFLFCLPVMIVSHLLVLLIPLLPFVIMLYMYVCIRRLFVG